MEVVIEKTIIRNWQEIILIGIHHFVPVGGIYSVNYSVKQKTEQNKKEKNKKKGKIMDMWNETKWEKESNHSFDVVFNNCLYRTIVI